MNIWVHACIDYYLLIKAYIIYFIFFFLQNKIYTLTQSKYSIYIYIWNFILLYFLPITPQSCVVECVIFLFNSSFCPELVTNLLYLSWAVCRPSYVAHDFCTCIKYETEAFIWGKVTSAIMKIFIKCFVIIFIYRCSLLFSFTKILRKKKEVNFDRETFCFQICIH